MDINTLLAKIPDEVIFHEARRRKTELTKLRGPYATMKKMVQCSKCKKEFSTRGYLAHRCPGKKPVDPTDTAESE